MGKNITALIKPASSLCNMTCAYCFYRDIADNREQYSYGIMKQDVAEKLIKKTLDYAEGGPVTYCFQGGEPLLAGIGFFQEFVTKVEAYNAKNSPITYSLQTNGTLLTDEFCRLFHEYSFLLGVSLDGTREVHNQYRSFAEKKGTFKTVCKGIELLKKYQIEFNVLSVVTAYSAKHIKENWKFFRQQGFYYLQFINCLEPIGCQPFSTEYAMDNEQYFKFHKELFELYMEENRSGKPVSVRHLDNLMARLYGRPVEQCDMLGRCFGQLVVEADGRIYPCDFYCEDKYCLGNITECDLAELENSSVMHRFVEASLKVEESCRECPVRNICRGGCRRERDYMSDGQLRANMYCEGRKKFYEYVLSYFGNETR